MHIPTLNLICLLLLELSRYKEIIMLKMKAQLSALSLSDWHQKMYNFSLGYDKYVYQLWT